MSDEEGGDVDLPGVDFSVSESDDGGNGYPDEDGGSGEDDD